MRRWLLVPWLLVAACAPDGAAVTDDPRPRPLPITTDGGVACVRPEEGCPCADGQEPLDCYADPVEGGDGSLVCHAGTQYCRDGAWSACETVREFRIGGTGTALITGPDMCNPCDPRCFVSRATPTPGDLTATNSTNVSYDATAGGITLTPGIPVTSIPPDSDGDGVPDVADDCVGAGWFRNADGTCTSTGLYHTLPYGATAIDPLLITVQIRTADVYFLMDTTGSMGGELARLKADLTTGSFVTGCSGGIIGAIRCTIPDAWFGVGYHDDYPVDPYGGAGDFVYRNVLDIQSSVSAAQTAVNSLAIHWGNDGPESETQALYSIATGAGLSSWLGARTGCPAGSWGYPCFRAGTIPIVVLITDAPFHNGPGDIYPYCLGCSTSALPLPTPTAVSGNERQDATAYPGGGAAIDITTGWIGFSGNTSAMVNDVDFGCGSGARDAVFRVRLTSTQTVRFTTDGSSYDTVLGVFPVGGGGWCDDDSGPGLNSQLDLTLGAGDYWVIVDGWGGGSGAYRLSMGRATSTTGFTGVSWAQATDALAARGVRTITVQTCGYWSDSYCLQGEQHARDLGNATGAVGSSGAPYVFRGNADGTGLSSTIVNAIVDLANYSRMDISARVVGDTRGFTRLPITAVSWGPRGSCTGISGGTTFVQCLPGTDVNFSVTFRNDVVMPTTVPQVFEFVIEVVGDGTVVLQQVPVRIVVPAVAASYPSSGTFLRDYDSTLRCAINESPDWGQLSWAATIPAGTRIEFELRAATSAAALPTAMPVGRVITPTRTSPIDLAAELRAAGYPDGLPYLRVTAVLYSNATRTASPTLTSMDVTYRCLPSM